MREAAGLSQRALADALSTNPAFVSRIEQQHYDWLPAPDTVRAWAAATGHPGDEDELLGMLADAKAAAARQAVTRTGRQGWCSQHRQERSGCRADQTHVYAMRQRGDLMAEVEQEAGRQDLDLNAFVTLALENAVTLSREGNLRNARQLQRYRPSPAKSAPRKPAPRRRGKPASPATVKFKAAEGS